MSDKLTAEQYRKMMSGQSTSKQIKAKPIKNTDLEDVQLLVERSVNTVVRDSLPGSVVNYDKGQITLLTEEGKYQITIKKL